MLKKENRFGKNDIKYLKDYKKIYQEFFIAKYKTNYKEKKITVVLSKKAIKKAVNRNFKRRQIYNIFQKYLNLLPNTYIIIYGKKNILKANYKTLDTEILDLIKKINEKTIQ